MTFTELSAFLDRLPKPRIFWWRDDDTGDRGPELSEFLALRKRVNMPLVISAVPAWLSEDCSARLNADDQVFVAQHGYCHQDHAPVGEKSIELGGNAAPQRVVEQIQEGQRWLRQRGLANLLPLLVPPWNRIHDAVIQALPELGFQSLSTYAKDRRGAMSGLRHINCHIDPILWRKGKRQMAEAELADVTIQQLTSNENRPTGLLTHHLDMDEPAFDLLERYLKLLGSHPNIDCPDPASLFGDCR